MPTADKFPHYYAGRGVYAGNFHVSHAPAAVIRTEEQAQAATRMTIAEVWSMTLAQQTLAMGDRLLEYVCRAKLVNSLPLTPAETSYLATLSPL